MHTLPSNVVSALLVSIGVALLVIVALLFFSPEGRDSSVVPEEVEIVDLSPAPDLSAATSSPPVASLPEPPLVPIPTPTVPPKEDPPVVTPPPPPPPENPPPQTVGTTTLAIGTIPLLGGGTAHAGESVPIAYLQITNVGTAGALLQGFWVKQNGSAPVQAVIGLSTVDDKGGSRGLAGGTEGATPFKEGLAFAPTDAYFAPGQMKLFTIKAILTKNISAYVGTNLIISVTSVETTAAVQGQFPIAGTVWVLAP